MAFTYTWQQLTDMVLAQVKNMPLAANIGAMQADFVSSDIAARYPWKPQITTFEDGQIVLVNNQQDYDPPINIWRLQQAWLKAVSLDPPNTYNLDIRDTLPIDLLQRSPSGIRALSLEAGVGKLRLECAAYVDPSTTWELQGTYQINPTKVSNLSQPLWFGDQYAAVAIEGLTYWAYKLADDARSDNQYLKFQAAIERMKQAEDMGGDDQMFPADPLGVTHATGFPNIFGL